MKKTIIISTALVFLTISLIVSCSKSSNQSDFVEPDSYRTAQADLKNPDLLSEDEDFIKLSTETFEFLSFLSKTVKEKSLSLPELQTQLSTLQSKNLSYEEQMSSINSIFRTDISPRVSIHILTLQSKWGKIESTYGVIPHQKLEKEVEAVFAKKYGEQHKEGTLTDVLVSADCGWRFYLCAAGITAAAIICHSSCSSAAVVATAGLGIPACLLLCGTIQIAGFAECDDRYC